MSCTYPSDRSDVDEGHGIVASHQRVKRLEASETVCVIAPKVLERFYLPQIRPC